MLTFLNKLKEAVQAVRYGGEGGEQVEDGGGAIHLLNMERTEELETLMKQP